VAEGAGRFGPGVRVARAIRSAGRGDLRGRAAIRVPQVPRLRGDQRTARTARTDPRRKLPAQCRREERADNVKLGRGGIREIEFIAQAFQIIRAGRDPGLRSRSTLETLATLGRQGVLPAATCDRLATSYVFLRNLEHALQYVDDAQTHALPADREARARVARLLGASSVDAMLGEYRAVQDFVDGVFDTVFSEPTETTRQAPMPATWNTPATVTTRPWSTTSRSRVSAIRPERRSGCAAC